MRNRARLCKEAESSNPYQVVENEVVQILVKSSLRHSRVLRMQMDCMVKDLRAKINEKTELNEHFNW